MLSVVPTDQQRIRAEAFVALEKLPATQLLDLIANAATYPKETRLQAARIALKRAGDPRGNSELARKIRIRAENEAEFRGVVEEAGSILDRSPI